MAAGYKVRPPPSVNHSSLYAGDLFGGICFKMFIADSLIVYDRQKEQAEGSYQDTTQTNCSKQKHKRRFIMSHQNLLIDGGQRLIHIQKQAGLF
jgi:hypothetical protein